VRKDVEKYVCSSHLGSPDRKGNGVFTVFKMCQSFRASTQHTLYPSEPVRSQHITCITIAISKSPAREIVTYT